MRNWNEHSDLEVARLCAFVYCSVGGRWWYDDFCFILTLSLKIAFLLTRIRILSLPFRSNSMSSWCHWAEWCHLPFLRDNHTGSHVSRRALWRHGYMACAAYWPSLTDGPETAFLGTDFKPSSFLHWKEITCCTFYLYQAGTPHLSRLKHCCWHLFLFFALTFSRIFIMLCISFTKEQKKQNTIKFYYVALFVFLWELRSKMILSFWEVIMLPLVRGDHI